MQQGRARVVVGEGREARKGLLRFVLEGEGFDVVGEAPDAAELAKLLAVEQPDVVVLDDGIGVTAVQLTHEVAPAAKVVLVWPGAVVPIGGDARVEPSEVLRGLGPAVSQVAGLAGLLESFERPDWIDKVRKDPATLRELLAARGAQEAADRPSITELQRKAQQAEPAKEPIPAADDGDDEHIAPVLILPTAASAEPTIVLPPAVVAASAPPAPPEHERAQEEEEHVGAVAAVAATATAAASAAQPDPIATEFNRRLGTIALGGAALIGAVVLSLGVSASRVPVSVVNANPSVITSSPPPPPPASPTGQPTGGATYPPKPTGGNQPPPRHGGPGPATLGVTHSGTGGDSGNGGGANSGGGHGGGHGGGNGGGNGGNGGGNGGNGGGNGGGNSTPTTHGKAHQHHGHNDDPTPGHSGEHNPHGGPPGHQDPKPSSPPPKTGSGHGATVNSHGSAFLHRHKR